MGGSIGLYVLRSTRLSSTGALPHRGDGVCISLDAIGASRHCTDRPDLSTLRAAPSTGRPDLSTPRAALSTGTDDARKAAVAS